MQHTIFFGTVILILFFKPYSNIVHVSHVEVTSLSSLFVASCLLNFKISACFPFLISFSYLEF